MRMGQSLVSWTANPRGGCRGLRRQALVWPADAVRVELQQSTTNTQTIQRYQREHPEPQVRERLGAAMTWPWPSSSHSASVPVLALNQSTSACPPRLKSATPTTRHCGVTSPTLVTVMLSKEAVIQTLGWALSTCVPIKTVRCIGTVTRPTLVQVVPSDDTAASNTSPVRVNFSQ